MKFVAAIILFFTFSVHAQKRDPKIISNHSNDKYFLLLQRQLDSLFADRKAANAPGAAIAIVKDGEIVYKKGYGYANLEYNIPNTPSTVFHIASLSKQFTALSILLLANDGKLSINDNINKYLPEMPVFEKPVTILNLLNHTSGLREWIYLLGIQGYRLNDMFTQEQIIKVISNQKELNFEPGSKFMYVNSGYNLLGEIVARVSGMWFAQFVNQRIFVPLNMTHSMVLDDYSTIVKNEADSYAPDGQNGYKKKVLSFVNVIGSTGVLTTVADLSKWAANFGTPKVGSNEIFNQMKQRGILNNSDTTNYAMGQFIGNYRGLEIIEHSGSDAGFRSHLLRFPKQGVSVIVLANDASLNAGDLAYRIADIYLKKELKVNQSAVAKPSPAALSGNVKTDPQQLMKYAGRYELQPGLIMDFTVEGDNLSVNATGQGKFMLQQLSPEVFKINGVNGVITFKRDEPDEVDKISFEINGAKMQGSRIKEKELSPEDLMQYTGQYYSKELNTTYSIIYEKGRLLAKNNRSDDTVLSQVKGDNFSGDQWFMGIVKFIRDDKQIVTGFIVSSDRVSNLRFDKK